MDFTFRWISMCLFAPGLVCAVLAGDARAQSSKETPNTPAAIRKVLDQNITVDYNGQSVEEVLDHLRKKTKLNIVVDQLIFHQKVRQAPVVVDGHTLIAPESTVAPGSVFLKIDNGKVRTALQKLLGPYDLTFVIVGDSVFITSEEAGQARQLRQRVSIDLKDQPLAAALKKLADETGVNLLVDPQAGEKAKAKVTAQLDDVALETVVFLLAGMADMAAVTVENVIVVTSDARAEQLRKQNASKKTLVPNLYVPYEAVPPPPVFINPPK